MRTRFPRPWAGAALAPAALIIILALVAVASSAAAASQGYSLVLRAPETASPGEKIVIGATLVENDSAKPVAGVEVEFRRLTAFNGSIVLGRAITDANGSAQVEYVVSVNSSFSAVARASAPDGQMLEARATVGVSGVPYSPGNPTGAAVVAVLVIAAILASVWSTYGFVLVQLTEIRREGGRAERDGYGEEEEEDEGEGEGVRGTSPEAWLSSARAEVVWIANAVVSARSVGGDPRGHLPRVETAMAECMEAREKTLDLMRAKRAEAKAAGDGSEEAERLVTELKRLEEVRTGLRAASDRLESLQQSLGGAVASKAVAAAPPDDVIAATGPPAPDPGRLGPLAGVRLAVRDIERRMASRGPGGGDAAALEALIEKAKASSMVARERALEDIRAKRAEVKRAAADDPGALVRLRGELELLEALRADLRAESARLEALQGKLRGGPARDASRGG